MGKAAKTNRSKAKQADAPPARLQVAALPYRLTAEEGMTVALVTSRETRRWVLPKGWRERGMKAHTAASREAREEAGLVGRIETKPVGTYTYLKRMPDQDVLCTVDVFPLGVKRAMSRWQEKGERHILWVPPEEAAKLVDEPELAEILMGFSQARSLVRAVEPDDPDDPKRR